jgi:hypothetical protein
LYPEFPFHYKLAGDAHRKKYQTDKEEERVPRKDGS